MGKPATSGTRFLVVLKLPEDFVGRLVSMARRIVEAVGESPYFASPRPSLATIASAIDALSAAQTATLSRTVGTVAVRDEKRSDLVMLLQELANYVQSR